MNRRLQRYAARLEGYRYFLLQMKPPTVIQDAPYHPLSEQLAWQLTADCRRSLLSYRELFEDLPSVQNTYLESVTAAFEALPTEASSAYLQGVLDVIEAPFIALTYPCPVKRHRVHEILATVLWGVYIETRFDVQYYDRVAGELAHRLRLPVDRQLAQVQLLRIAVTQGMHCTDSPSFNIFMSRVIIEQGIPSAIALAERIVDSAASGGMCGNPQDECSEFEYFSELWRKFDENCHAGYPERLEKTMRRKEAVPVYLAFVAAAIATFIARK